MFLAADTSLIPPQYLSSLIVAGVVAALLTFALLFNTRLQIWERIAPKSNNYVVRAEWEQTLKRIDNTITREEADEIRRQLGQFEERSDQRAKGNEALIRALEGRVEKDLADFERRVTGDIAAGAATSERRFGEMGGQLLSLTNSVAALSNDVMRAMGRLEGARDEARAKQTLAPA